MVKVWRTIRISDGIANWAENFLKTRKSKDLGIITIKDAIEYYCRKGIEKD